MALDSNLSVRSSKYSVDVQKALKGASWDIPKTSIDGQYGQFNSYSKDNSFTVSQSFAFPTVYINQNKLAKANIKSSEWQLKTSQTRNCHASETNLLAIGLPVFKTKIVCISG